MSIVKGKTGMGERTGSDLFFTRGPVEYPPDGTYAYKFCKELLKAGKDGRTKKEIRGVSWNQQGHYFKQTYNRLVREGLAFNYDDHNKYMLTSKGIATGINWVK
jgi:hypothetical protein